jgi:molybdate transport system substrate-binding protein
VDNPLPRSLLLLSLFLLPLISYSETLRIAVAANFTGATQELVSRFEQRSGHELKVSFGSTGKLYAQITHGAPFALFLAADEARPARLIQEGLAVAGSRTTYARGRLVLWSADEKRITEGADELRQGAFRRLAIANPQTAPYGLAAQQVLQHLGLWNQLSGALVRGDSIAQTFQFTATGNAELGLVAASQVKAWPHKGSLWEIPQGYYQSIAQQVVLLKHGEESDAAKDFLQFLQSDEARAVIRDFGYAVE